MAVNLLRWRCHVVLVMLPWLWVVNDWGQPLAMVMGGARRGLWMVVVVEEENDGHRL